MSGIDWLDVAHWGDPATCVHESSSASDLEAEPGE